MTLENNALDRIAASAKGLAGLIPYLGGPIAEAVGQLIPAQRLDRVVDFLRKLDSKLGALDDALKRQRVLRDLDLIEAAVLHSTRASSDERRERIACLVANSLTAEEVDLLREKKLLDLLSELNDAELVILHSHGQRIGSEANSYHERHKDILQIPSGYIGGPPELVDGETISRAYRAHMERLGLLRPNFKKPRRGDLPEFDEKTGMMKASGREITWLGRMVLNAVDLPDDVRNEATS